MKNTGFRRFAIALALAVLLGLAPAAYADSYLAPYAGVNFGGDVGTPLNVSVKDRNRATFGFGLGAMGGGVFGIELDLSYTPKFYTDTNLVVTKNNLLTVMPTLIFGIPIGGQQGAGVRPYATAGAGLIRRDFDFGSIASVSSNDLGFALGGGVMIFVSDGFGIRGDVRYFRNFTVDEFSLSSVNFEKGTFNFGRASLAAVFRF